MISFNAMRINRFLYSDDELRGSSQSSREVPRELQELPLLCFAEWTLATFLQEYELGVELRFCG
jgi:hypothetical protein